MRPVFSCSWEPWPRPRGRGSVGRSSISYYGEGWHLSVSDGYYVMLAPLSSGQHTIHILTGWTDAEGVFHLFCDVYYNLTVER